MDITKAKAAIETAIKEVNTLTDSEFKARRIDGLRRLTNAAGALELAGKHLETAKKQSEPKTTAAAEAPAGK